MVQSNQTPPPFNVRRSEPELVFPSQPTPNELKLLSDIDEQTMVWEILSIITFYPAEPSMKDTDPAKVIKKALADALVYYYPWAGRVRYRDDNQTQKLAVDCSAQGVVFGEADADISLEELGKPPLLPPFPYFDKLLYSDTMKVIGCPIGCPMLTMQVTRLLCGGFILAFSFNHLLSDGEGVIKFLTAMTELARGASAPSIIPVWQRDLLTSPDPCHVTPKIPDYASISYAAGDEIVHRNFSFSARDVAALRARIPPQLQPCTTFELIASALWHCRTVGFQYKPEEEVHLAFVVSARRKFIPPLPDGFYGNAITCATAVSPAGKICNDTNLGYIMELVKTAKGTVIDEYKRSLINPGILRGSRFPIDATTYVISDLSQIGPSAYQLDFGWGKPLYIGPANNSNTPRLMSYIMPIRDENGEEVKVVPVYFPKDAMDRFSKALENLLKE